MIIVAISNTDFRTSTIYPYVVYFQISKYILPRFLLASFTFIFAVSSIQHSCSIQIDLPTIRVNGFCHPDNVPY